jgi:hypothetical protein
LRVRRRRFGEANPDTDEAHRFARAREGFGKERAEIGWPMRLSKRIAQPER